MKEPKMIILSLLTGIFFSCLITAFIWAVFSIVNGSVNGGEWYGPSQFFFCVMSILTLASCIVAAISWIVENE